MERKNKNHTKEREKWNKQKRERKKRDKLTDKRWLNIYRKQVSKACLNQSAETVDSMGQFILLRHKHTSIHLQLLPTTGQVI